MPTPSANPTVPDLLVSLGGGGGRLLADSREESGGRSHTVRHGSGGNRKRTSRK